MKASITVINVLGYQFDMPSFEQATSYNELNEKKLIYDQLLKYLFNTALRYIKLLQFIGHVYILAILLYFF